MVRFNIATLMFTDCHTHYSEHAVKIIFGSLSLAIYRQRDGSLLLDLRHIIKLFIMKKIIQERLTSGEEL